MDYTPSSIVFSTSQVAISFEVTIPGHLSTRTTPSTGRVMIGQVASDCFVLLVGLSSLVEPISAIRFKRGGFDPTIDMARLSWDIRFMSGDVSHLSAAAGLPTYATTSLSLGFSHPSAFWAFLYASSLPLIPAWISYANGKMNPEWANLGWQSLLGSFTSTHIDLEFPMEKAERQDDAMITSI